MKVVKCFKGITLAALLLLASLPMKAEAVSGEFGFDSEVSVSHNLTIPAGSTEIVKFSHTLDADDFFATDGSWDQLDAGDKVDISTAELLTVGFSRYNVTDRFDIRAFLLDPSLTGGEMSLGTPHLNDAVPTTVTWDLNIISDEALTLLENKANLGDAINFRLEIRNLESSSVALKITDTHLSGTGSVVPEPLSIFLLGSSLAGFGAWKKKELFSSND